jgi:hypothetical protein
VVLLVGLSVRPPYAGVVEESGNVQFGAVGRAGELLGEGCKIILAIENLQMGESPGALADEELVALCGGVIQFDPGPALDSLLEQWAALVREIRGVP